MRHGSSVTSWSKKITPGMRFAPFLPPKKTHRLGIYLGNLPFSGRPEALLCSSAMVSWFPPGVLPQVLVFFSQSTFYHFDSWKLRRLNLLFLGFNPPKDGPLQHQWKTAGSSKGSSLGMKKVQLAIQISNRKSCHDKSNDESFGTPTRSLPTPRFSVVFFWSWNDKVTHQRVLRWLKGLRHPRYSC